MSIFQNIASKAVSRRNPAASKKIANNTYAERYGDDLAAPDAVGIRLHATTVVKYLSDDTVVLNTGGWKTVTTKARINDWLPDGVRLYSDRGEWFLSVTGTRVPYADGVTLQRFSISQWYAVPGTFPSETEEARAIEAKKKLRADIKGFVAKAARSLPVWAKTLREQGSISTAGDCWYCVGIVSNFDGTSATDNVDHLWAHLRDGYVFPSLFLNAYADKGYRNPAVVFSSDLSYGPERALKLVSAFLFKRLSVAAEPQANTALLAHYLEQAKDVLEKPSDFGYFGGDDALWFSSAPTWTKHRDSSNEDIANFTVVWETLKAEFPDLFSDDLDADGHPARDFNLWPAIYVFGAGHWAVGHIDQIVVPVLADPTRPLAADNLHPAFIRVCEFGAAVKSYPLLDGAEDIASRLDYEQALSEIRQHLVDPTDEQLRVVYSALTEGDGTYPEYLETEEWVRIIDGIDPEVGLVLQDWAASRREDADV